MMLYIEFEGGNRQLYSCTDPSLGDACAPASPANPATAPNCLPVDK
jgi:hypothetical protein